MYTTSQGQLFSSYLSLRSPTGDCRPRLKPVTGVPGFLYEDQLINRATDGAPPTNSGQPLGNDDDV
jgi:hypothetical protein